MALVIVKIFISAQYLLNESVEFDQILHYALTLMVADWANFDMTKITDAPLSFPDCCFGIYNVCKIK